MMKISVDKNASEEVIVNLHVNTARLVAVVAKSEAVHF
jgi:hypothetical protein